MSEIDVFIKAAENISASGRQNDLNKTIIEFAEKADDENFWLERVFSGLAFRNFYDFQKLREIMKVDNNGSNLSEVAYHSRNLLEVAIWTAYCFQSRENAHKFYSDVGRDGDDLLKKQLHHGIEIEKTIVAREKLKASAEKHNVDDIEKRFTKVCDAAKDIGMKDTFLIQNKVFSKFAHPTALQIIFPQNGPEAHDLKKAFYGQASVLFAGSVHILEDRYGLSGSED